MQSTNEIRKQISKLGFLLTALLVSVARAQQAHANGVAEPREQPARRIIVSIPDRKLALIENGEVTRVFPVAVGKASTPSPAGSFRIISRVTNPTYYHEGKIVPPGPANPVGTRWMGLSERGYGIHGTNAPNSIGKAASLGCIRMARTDLEQLFAMVRVGDPVEIRSERDSQTAAIFAPVEKPVVTEQAVIADARMGAKNAAH